MALALEPRILFDAAVASAATDPHHTSGHTPGPAADATEPHADPAAHATPTQGPASSPATGGAAAPAELASAASRHLVVVDARVSEREQLLAGLPAGTEVLVLQGGQDGVAAIAAALAEIGRADSVQIFSHGGPGQVLLGSRLVSADNLGSLAASLEAWRDHLAQDADIQLYGCSAGAGPQGQALVEGLALLTGADVGASDDATGAAAAGGDWQLEVQHGTLDQPLMLAGAAREAFQGLLADAAPTVSLGGAGQDVLLGDQFSFTVTFSNTSAQDGYAPFINLFLPATGKDGDDGVRFVSATYLGQTLASQVVTFDANGQAVHPLAKDASGNPVVLNAATYGLRPGDQLAVVRLPFASVSQDQPAFAVQVTASLSSLADTALTDGSPDLTIKVGSGFELGNDALDNPAQDPSLIATGTVSYVVHPTMVTLTQTVNAPDGETATGPNYGRTYTLTARPAPGQTLSNVVITQPLPDSIQVTAITPGSGGTLTSVTLGDGTVLTNPTAVQAAIAADDLFIHEFTVAYASLSAASDTVVSFYVPEEDSSGAPVLDAGSGNPVTITVDAASASAQWTPLDPRDLTSPATYVDISGTGTAASFIARSIVLEKQAAIQVDAGQSGLTPGDTLRYTINLSISDFFAFGKDFFRSGQFIVTDTMADGQTLSGTPTLSFSVNGASQSIALVATSTVNADGTTSLSFDVAQSLLDATRGARGWLNGDLAFDAAREGATTAVISYAAVVGQSYTPPAGAPHSEINEGDAIGNTASTTATVLEDMLNLSGQSQTDSDSTTSTVPTRNVDIEITEINGGTPGGGDLHPGDLVTFRLSYDLVTGDYEQFKLSTYLPLPLLDVSGLTWATGGAAGQWEFGSGHTSTGPAPTVSSVAGNGVEFDFGSFATAGTSGSRIEVEFTLRVGDQPFADRRSLGIVAESSQVTTLTDATLLSSDGVVIHSVAEPHLDIRHGVVSASHGTVTGTTGTWQAPGSSGVPFTGSITDLAAVDGVIAGIDGGDLLRLATAIENTGGGGAFDVRTDVALPSGLSFVGGSLANANLRVYRGDGTALAAGTNYTVVGNEIRFLDPGSVASLQGGRSGSAADASGANVVVITYDVVAASAIEAGRSLQSTATLSHYASVAGGPDFTPTDLQDLSTQQVAAPEVRKTFAGGTLDDGDSSASHTTGSDLVVGWHPGRRRGRCPPGLQRRGGHGRQRHRQQQLRDPRAAGGEQHHRRAGRQVAAERGAPDLPGSGRRHLQRQHAPRPHHRPDRRAAHRDGARAHAAGRAGPHVRRRAGRLRRRRSRRVHRHDQQRERQLGLRRIRPHTGRQPAHPAQQPDAAGRELQRRRHQQRRP